MSEGSPNRRGGTDTEENVDASKDVNGDAATTAESVEPFGEHLPSTFKVRGELAHPGGVGVEGRNTAVSGTSYGVYGGTDSTDMAAAGVLGTSSGSGEAYGVMGLVGSETPTQRTDRAGVYGEGSGQNEYGLMGINSSTTDPSAEGVFGLSQSPNSPAITGKNPSGGAGVRSNGDLEVINGNLDVQSGSLSVGGHASTGTVGLSAYMLWNQTIQPSTPTIVHFDSVQDSRDDFGGFDEATGVYEVQVAGDYHVDVGIKWKDDFSAGTIVQYQLQIDGSRDGGVQIDRRISDPDDHAISYSKTLFGLSETETIQAEVWHNDSASNEVFGHGDGITYMTIHKVG